MVLGMLVLWTFCVILVIGMFVFYLFVCLGGWLIWFSLVFVLLVFCLFVLFFIFVVFFFCFFLKERHKKHNVEWGS